MNIPAHFNPQLSLRKQIIYVLSLIKKGSPEEVAMELIELRGISSEEGVADLTVDIENALYRMEAEAVVRKAAQNGEPLRYRLQNENDL